VRDDGGYTDDDWAKIYGEGGAGVVPAGFSIDYRRPAFKPHPSAWLAWLLVLPTLFFLVPVIVAVPIAARAGIRGNRLAWLAVAANLVAAVGCFWLWPAVRR
jgi:hypothetical protein